MLPVVGAFPLEGAPIACEPYGDGHINRTYRVTTNAGRRYILQRVNRAVFPNVSALMENIVRVCDWIRARDPLPYHALEYLPTADGRYYAVDDQGAWRMCRFLEGGVCPEQATDARDMAQAGAAFGRFQRLLREFPAHTLHETIPNFHDTPRRFADFARAVDEDRAGRLATARAEADALLALQPEAYGLTRLRDAGALPLRVTHNDAKLGNVVLDARTREPLCVIDLDTVMPGLAGNDYADSLRTGACTAAEATACPAHWRAKSGRSAAARSGASQPRAARSWRSSTGTAQGSASHSAVPASISTAKAPGGSPSQDASAPA